MMRFGPFFQSQSKFLFWHLTKSRNWSNAPRSRATAFHQRSHKDMMMKDGTSTNAERRRANTNNTTTTSTSIESETTIKFSALPCQSHIVCPSVLIWGNRHQQTSSLSSSIHVIPKPNKSNPTPMRHFCRTSETADTNVDKTTKNRSNDKSVTSEVEENIFGEDNTQEQVPEEWKHPSTRDDSILQKDSELRSILSDMASDFGRDDSSEPIKDGEKRMEEDTKEKHLSNDVDKVEVNDDDDDDVSVVYFEESPEGGFQVVESNSEERTKPDVANIKGSSHRKANGFFSIADIVEILREDNAKDICVIKVPKAKQYVDYFVVVTGRSTRHLKAMTSYLNKVYKQSKGEKDPFMKIEGKYTDDWMSIDFGDIVVHFMLEETRELYELEMLWTLGPEFDDQYQRILQYRQTTILQPDELAEEELQEVEDEASHQEGYSVVIESKEESEAEIAEDKRI